MAARVALLVALIASPLVSADASVLQQLASSQFSGFQRLMEHADLLPEVEAALKGGKGLTLFCPTDDALMYNTSPTLLAFLKLRENREVLRKVLLSHIVAERLSPFQWGGQHATLSGTKIALTMDAHAFYAAGAAVTQYNVLAVGGNAVHSIPTLILPADVGSSSGIRSLVEEGSDIRRILQADAPAPSPSGGITVTPPPGPPKGGSAKALISSFVAVAALAAYLLC